MPSIFSDQVDSEDMRSIQPNYIGSNWHFLPETAIDGGSSVPELDVIAGWGFDAIVQIREDRLAQELRSNAGLTAEQEAVYHDELVSDVVRERINERIAELDDAEPSDGSIRPFPSDLSVEYAGVSFYRIKPRRTEIVLEGTRHPTVTFKIRIDIDIVQTETIESWRRAQTFLERFARIGPHGIPEPFAVPERRERSALLVSGYIELPGMVSLQQTPSRYEAQAVVSFESATATVTASSAIFTDLAEGPLQSSITDLLSALTHSGTSSLALTPLVSLAGSLPGRESVRPADDFIAQLVATDGNVAGSRVLAIAITTAPGVAPDIRALAPFLGENNFAYYASTRVLRNVADIIWRRSGDPRTIENEVAARFAIDGEETLGRAKVRMNFESPPREVRMVTQPDGTGAVAIIGTFTIQLLELKDDRHRVIDSSSWPAGLADSQETTFSFHIVPHGAEIVVWPDAAARRMIQNIATPILNSVLVPVDGFLTRAHGQCSFSLGCITRGFLL